MVGIAPAAGACRVAPPGQGEACTWPRLQVRRLSLPSRSGPNNPMCSPWQRWTGRGC